MKKIFIMLFALILLAIGVLGIRYLTRNWEEVEGFTAYFYLKEDMEADEDSPLKEWEKRHEKIQKSADDAFPPSFLKEYEERAGIVEYDRNSRGELHYPAWKMQCDNMLTSGMVSVTLYDADGNILYQRKKITRDTGSFEEELTVDIIQKVNFLMILQEEEGTEGSFCVTLFGR